MTFFKPEGKKIGDFSLFVKDNKLYCLFIEKTEEEEGNSYGLAESIDSFTWKYNGRILSPPTTGSLWAMDYFENMLFYSVVNDITGNPYPSQKVNMALSNGTGEFHKTKMIISNNIKEYYYDKNSPKFCWRDPFIYKKEDTYYCLLAARDKSKPYEKSACVAQLKSTNLIDWTFLPPLFSPKKYWEIETPCIYWINGKQVLTYGTYDNGMSMKFIIGQKYVEPILNNFTPAYCYAGRIIKFNEEDLFYHWIRNPSKGKMATWLAPPKVVELKNNFLFLKKHPKVKTVPYFDDKIILKNQTISFTKTAAGISIAAMDNKQEPLDLRTIPLEEISLEIYEDDQFIEVYCGGYFVYAAVK